MPNVVPIKSLSYDQNGNAKFGIVIFWQWFWQTIGGAFGGGNCYNLVLATYIVALIQLHFEFTTVIVEE